MEKINTDYKRQIWKIEAKLFIMRIMRDCASLMKRNIPRVNYNFLVHTWAFTIICHSIENTVANTSNAT